MEESTGCKEASDSRVPGKKADTVASVSSYKAGSEDKWAEV